MIYSTRYELCFCKFWLPTSINNLRFMCWYPFHKFSFDT
uniref:Uncharacterized protein n=1 Tax=Rhizophora mucronata TaxID=61149 RepID=A0A2P2IQA5_RHIMU